MRVTLKKNQKIQAALASSLSDQAFPNKGMNPPVTGSDVSSFPGIVTQDRLSLQAIAATPVPNIDAMNNSRSKPRIFPRTPQKKNVKKNRRMEQFLLAQYAFI
ncbi:hypothetical protein DSM101010T_00870 [Desulfovibrio subterraneus]|uniref:Uncharacterized protein n=1 Tax=Desulfovibrio subterraneus TaxID=2718620 RepID=A0A7J0BEW3_9BACT|nr:hypothetical protein DSM101010T_00870 [Desulfovibrio subterraneus]